MIPDRFHFTQILEEKVPEHSPKLRLDGRGRLTLSTLIKQSDIVDEFCSHSVFLLGTPEFRRAYSHPDIGYKHLNCNSGFFIMTFMQRQDYVTDLKIINQVRYINGVDLDILAREYDANALLAGLPCNGIAGMLEYQPRLFLQRVFKC